MHKQQTLKHQVWQRGAQALALFSLFGVVLGACGKKAEENSLECAPVDQKASFLDRLPEVPSRVVIDSKFSQTERDQIVKAVNEWNRVKGQILSVGVQDMPASARSGDFRSCELMDQSLNNDAHQIPILKEESMTRWNDLGLSSQIPALTIRCSSSGELTRQLVFVNTAITDATQFRSIVLHELGHSLGLDHSCSSSGGDSSFVACSSLSKEHEYHQAVMYPSLRASNGGSKESDGPEIKESLKANDQTRLGCRYSGIL